MRSSLLAKQHLTSAEIAQIEQLAQQCDAYDQATLRVNWDALAARPSHETNDFLYYEDSVLVGALALYSFSRREAEASGMVHPEQRRKGIFRALVAAGVEELRRRGIPRLVFFCDHKSGPGIAFLEAIGARYEYSEYRMDLEEARMPRSFDEHLHVDTATDADVDAIAHIAAVSFEGDEEETRRYIARSIHNPARRYIIARLDEEPVGSLNLSIDEQEVGIYGFGVLPEYRGRGYGRQILARAIAYAQAEFQKPIFLEVAPDNSNALKLYTSCGFKETNRYDYYTLEVHQVVP